MASIPLDKANFLALVLETLLYGCFLVLFFAGLYTIITKRSGINVKLLTTLVSMWVLATAHWVLDICRAVQAFVDLQDGNAVNYYLDLSNPLEAAKTAVYVTLTLVGDGFVIYRCYVIWNRWYIVPLPLLLLCGTGVTGFGTTAAFSRAAPGAQVFLADIVPWVTSFFALTFTTNVLCTFLISYRIISVQRELNTVLKQKSLAWSTLIILVESAAVYSTSVLVLLIAYTSESNAQYAILDMSPPIIGITFTVIILRVSTGISSRELSTNAGSTYRSQSTAENSFRLQRRNQPGDPLEVNISCLVENESFTQSHTGVSTKTDKVV